MKELLAIFGTVPGQISEVGDGGHNAGGLKDVVIKVINGIIGVVGLVAVVMVILGGISYMTSAGDASKVKKGKDTILYGLIGLVIVGLAFAIVNFVITNVIQ